MILLWDLIELVTDARDHLNRTKNSRRSNPILSTSVLAIEDLSPSIKQIKLLVKDEHKSEATFKVDKFYNFHIIVFYLITWISLVLFAFLFF